MKFSEYLLKNRTPEWSSQYIEYDEMKRILHESLNEAKRLSNFDNNAVREQYFLFIDEKFFHVSLTCINFQN